MSDQNDRTRNRKSMSEIVSRKQQRRLTARRDQDWSIWFGLGMFGLIGWSVSIPALGGVALGWWIDQRWPGPQSWTLMLMLIGVGIGCWNAWRWIHREGKLSEPSPSEATPEQEEQET